MSRSAAVKILDFALSFCLFAAILLGIAVAFTHWVAGVLIILSSFLVWASMKVVVEIASDVREISQNLKNDID